MNICTKCGEHPKRILSHTKTIVYDKICHHCYHMNQIEKQQDFAYKRETIAKEKKEAEENKSKIPRNVTCRGCKKNFTTTNKQVVYCQNPCKNPIEERRKELEEMSNAEKWLNQPKIGGNHARDGDKIAYAFFRKKYSPGKQFRTCRG